jgi:hypothetical protein
MMKHGVENNKRKRKLLSGRNKKTKRARSAHHGDKKVLAVEQE